MVKTRASGEGAGANIGRAGKGGRASTANKVTRAQKSRAAAVVAAGKPRGTTVVRKKKKVRAAQQQAPKNPARRAHGREEKEEGVAESAEEYKKRAQRYLDGPLKRKRGELFSEEQVKRKTLRVCFDMSGGALPREAAQQQVSWWSSLYGVVHIWWGPSPCPPYTEHTVACSPP